MSTTSVLHIFAALILAVSTCLRGNAQSNSEDYLVKVRRFTQDDGLPNQAVLALHEDDKGVIWVGTKSGLAAYLDGTIQLFTHEEGLPFETIQNIFPAGDGELWLVGADDILKSKLQVCLFDTKTGEVRVHHEGVSDASWVEREGFLFAAQENGVLLQFHPSGEVRKERISLKNAVFFYVLHGQNQEGKLWLHYEDTLAGENRFICFDSKTLERQDSTFSILSEDDNQTNTDTWFVEPSGIFRRTPRSLIDVSTQKRLTDYLPEYLNDPDIDRRNLWNDYLIYDPVNNLYWCFFHLELLAVDAASGDIKIRFKADEITGLTFRYQPLIDRNGNVWIPTNLGLVQITVRPRVFFPILDTSDENAAHQCRNIVTLPDETVLVSAEYDVFRVDPKKRTFSSYDFNIYKTKEALPESILAFSEDSILFANNHLIIESKGERMKFLGYLEGSPESHHPYLHMIRAMVSTNREVWLGTSQGLKTWAVGEKMLSKHEFDSNHSSLNTAVINHFHHLEDGHIWMLTDRGLFVLDQDAEVSESYREESTGRNYFPVNHLLHVYQQSDSVYWFGTLNRGLLRWNRDRHTFKRYTFRDGLPNNTVYAVFEDDEQTLWMSTDRGIAALDLNSETITSYQKEDGLSNTEFNRASAAQRDDGMIFFGGINGMTFFHPDSVRKSYQDQNIRLELASYKYFDSQTQLLNDQTLQARASHKLELMPYHDFFVVKVGIPDLKLSEKLQLEYRIRSRGRDAWIPVAGREISIGQLAFGEYTLEIRSTSQHDEANTLKLQVIWYPPFYRTNLFYLLVSITLLAALFIWFYQRQRAYRRNQKLLEAEVQRQTAQIREDKELIEEQTEQLKELDKAKSRFFANISHELRTPLSLIIGPITELRQRLKGEESQKEALELLNLTRAHSDLLLRRVNELLELSRMDAGRLSLIEAPTNLRELVEEVGKRFEGIAKEKEIDFKQSFEVGTNPVRLDGTKVEHILNNLLSNAFKFTPVGKSIGFSTKIESESKRIIFCVQDTGIGISEEDQKNIFERFYQAENGRQVDQQGSGIGLSLVQELVKLMNGEITLTSQPDSGTSFRV
ncbi:MAG: ATP-binding protein, partial [Bacteroidota bacterium]